MPNRPRGSSALNKTSWLLLALAVGAASSACSRLGSLVAGDDADTAPRKDEAASAPAASATPPASAAPAAAVASAAATAEPAPAADAPEPVGPPDGAAAPTADARKELARALDEGRKLSSAKDFQGALSAFDRALAVAPDDARVLTDVGWVAFQAGDLTRADEANRRALALTTDPKRRAQVLYNTGRVAEAKDDAEGARKAYAESLSLRENAEVKRRLTAVGGAPVAKAAPCSQAFPNVGALCACVRSRKDDLLASHGDGPLTCAAARTPKLGAPRLSVVTWGAESPLGERVHLLVARDSDGMRTVAELGRDFSPGAFGVHNEAEIKGGAVRKIGEREVVVIRSEQRHTDTNAAGLEACWDNTDLETVCALGDDARATRCVTVPVVRDSGCGAGVEVPEDEMDEETRSLLADLKQNWSKSRVTLGWALVEEDGAINVRVKSGKATGATAEAVGRRPLF